MNISVMTYFDGFIDRDKKKYLDLGLVLSNWLNEFEGDFSLNNSDNKIEDDRTPDEIVNDLIEKTSTAKTITIKVKKGNEHALMKLLIIFFTKYRDTEKYNLDSLEFLLNTNGFKIPHYRNIYFDELKVQISNMPFIPNIVVDTLDKYSNNACSREYEKLSLSDYYIAIAFEVLKRNYKYAVCQHCGKAFFKKSNREGNNKKYCKRQSPCKGYEHLQCEQAVRNIKQECTRVKNRIETKANNHYKLSKISNIEIAPFNNDLYFLCEPYQTQIAKRPNATLQEEYLSLLRKIDKGKEWLK